MLVMVNNELKDYNTINDAIIDCADELTRQQINDIKFIETIEKVDIYRLRTKTNREFFGVVSLNDIKLVFPVFRSPPE